MPVALLLVGTEMGAATSTLRRCTGATSPWNTSFFQRLWRDGSSLPDWEERRGLNNRGALRNVLLVMPASSALRAEKVGDRRAEQGGTPLRGPARLIQQPVGHSSRYPG